MIKSHEVEKLTTEIVVDDVICNCCGQSIKKHTFTDADTKKPFDVPDDYLEVNQTWGYFSNYNEEIHKFHICQSCYKKWIDSFIIPVEIKEGEY